MSTQSQLDRLCIDTIRTLSMDAVEKAASGHPGTPMALAPVVHVLYDRFLRFNPANPQWFNRDRFVLSAGHASMLLYSALHLNGYDLPLAELERFRQLHSRCPGHPEYTPGHRLTPGVEMRSYWGSNAAKTNGSFNLAGIADPVVDALIDKVIAAKSRTELTTATHAIDRVLREPVARDTKISETDLEPVG